MNFRKLLCLTTLKESQKTLIESQKTMIESQKNHDRISENHDQRITNFAGVKNLEMNNDDNFITRWKKNF